MPCGRVNLAIVGGVAGTAYLTHRYIDFSAWSMGMPDAETMGITALTIGDAWAAFSAMNPSMFTTKAFGRKGGTEGELTKRDLRLGAAIGTGMAGVVAVGASMVTNSWWPLVGTLAACAAQWLVLEHSLRNPWGTGDAISQQGPGGRLG